MRHDDDKTFRGQLLVEPLEAGRGQRVQAVRRLVHQDDAGVQRDGTGDGQSPKLPAGQTIGAGIEVARFQADLVEGSPRAAFDLPSGQFGGATEGQCYVLERGSGKRHGPLRNQPDTLTQRRRKEGGVSYVPAPQRDFSAEFQVGIVFVLPYGGAQQGRLAAARGSQDDGGPALGQFERQIVEDLDPAAMDGHVAKHEHQPGLLLKRARAPNSRTLTTISDRAVA